MDGVRRKFQLVNHDLREGVVLWIVGKQHCYNTLHYNLLCFYNYILYF